MPSVEELMDQELLDSLRDHRDEYLREQFSAVIPSRPYNTHGLRLTPTQSQEVLSSSESNEWYTPPRVMEYVKNVIGDEFLDPAASEESLTINPATFSFTAEDNGLEQLWSSSTHAVFLNPPFGKEGTRSRAGIWLEKMLEKYEAGEFEHGIALTHTRPGYEWWESMSRKVPICMARRKIDFIPADRFRNTSGSKTAQTFFYFGRDTLRFTEVFSELGRILVPVPSIFHGEIAIAPV